jgi:methylmalonyl-CoA mutase N-terminal domain/subunit
MRWAGANAIQEVAFAISNAICYINETLKKGLEIDAIAHKIELHLNAGHDLFEEVAKFRATRRIWAKLMKERYGARETRSMAVRISVYTAGYALTAQQPLNNVVRIAMQNLSAVLGGVQYINTASYDEALATPHSDAAVLSTRTQQILAYECGLTDTVDPLGGSYYVEALTNQLEQEIWALIDQVEAMGGAIAAVENGFYDKEMAEGAYRYYRQVESGERIIVGVNQFAQQEELPIPIFRPKPEVHEEQKRRVHELRASRDNLRVQGALEGIISDGQSSRNIMPAVLAAVKSYATIGEICDAFRRVYGEHKENLVHF